MARFLRFYGRRIQQEIHRVERHGTTKWQYDKDSNNAWHYFYPAYTNLPTSEKIVDIDRHHEISNTPRQLWAYIKRYN